jgi:hypothetical protein
MDDIENSSEFFYEQLSSTKNPALALAKFADTLFSRPVNRTDIIMYNRLIAIYGRFTVFFGILDMASMPEVDFERGVFGLLSFMCKRRLEAKYGIVMLDQKDLNKEAQTIGKLIEKQKKVELEVRPLDE